MSNKTKRILLLFTNHRVCEKLWPAVAELSKYYSIDLFCIGVFSKDTPWVGDINEIELVISRHRSFIDNVIYGPGIKYHGDTIRKDLSQYINLNLYDLVIYDDNRPKMEYNIPNLYREFKKLNIPVIGNSHGNENNPQNGFGIAYDHIMDFKTGGIPANDSLKSVIPKDKHYLLIITNFLGVRTSPFPLVFNEQFLDKCGALEYNLPIKVKIKTRLDYPNYQKEINYIHSFCDCEVIANTDNIDQLIAGATIVISAPSTLAFKPIQLGIPTVLIRGAGQIGSFKDYSGLVDLDKDQILNNLKGQLDLVNKVGLKNSRVRNKEFISSVLAGGNDFTSTEIYVEDIKRILIDWSKI